MGFFPTSVPAFNLLGVTDVTSALKTISTRNCLVSRTSVNLGFETSASVLFASGVSSSYATATNVSGTLSFPTALYLASRYTTVITINEGASPGTTTVSANGGAYSAVDESLQYNKSTGQGSPFIFQKFLIPIGFHNLTNITVSMNKASSTVYKNSQQVYILPGNWAGVTNNNATGGSNSSLSVNTNDIVFISGGLSRNDTTPPTISHSGTATHTRIIETNSTYGSTTGQMALHVIDSSGTFLSNAGSTSVTTTGGGHGGGGTITTTYYYDCFSQNFRFVSP